LYSQNSKATTVIPFHFHALDFLLTDTCFIQSSILCSCRSKVNNAAKENSIHQQFAAPQPKGPQVRIVGYRYDTAGAACGYHNSCGVFHRLMIFPA
jgi:hypothetical protein